MFVPCNVGLIVALHAFEASRLPRKISVKCVILICYKFYYNFIADALIVLHTIKYKVSLDRHEVFCMHRSRLSSSSHVTALVSNC
jgi:hypothetical protein